MFGAISSFHASKPALISIKFYDSYKYFKINIWLSFIFFLNDMIINEIAFKQKKKYISFLMLFGKNFFEKINLVQKNLEILKDT